MKSAKAPKVGKRKAALLTNIDNELQILHGVSTLWSSDNAQDQTWARAQWSRFRAYGWWDPSVDGIYEVMSQYSRKHGDVPGFSILSAKQDIDKATRAKLADVSLLRVDRAHIEGLVKLQIDVRKRRLLTQTLREANRLLEAGTAADIERAVNRTIALAKDVEATADKIYDTITALSATKRSERILSPDKPTRYKTGFPLLDCVFSGFEPGNLAILSATSGGCKTTVALNMWYNMVRKKYGVGYLTHENNADQIHQRLTSMFNVATLTKICEHDLTPKDRKDIELKYSNFDAAYLRDSDKKLMYWIGHAKRGSSTAVQLEAQIQRMPQIKIWFVDQVNNMVDRESHTYGNNQHVHYGNVGAKLMSLASKYNVVIIALAQMNTDGQIKYSREIFELAKFVITWGEGSLGSRDFGEPSALRKKIEELTLDVAKLEAEEDEQADTPNPELKTKRERLSKLHTKEIEEAENVERARSFDPKPITLPARIAKGGKGQGYEFSFTIDTCYQTVTAGPKIVADTTAPDFKVRGK